MNRLATCPGHSEPSAAVDYADDGRLVAALKTGEPSARAALVERYGPNIERIITSAVGLDGDRADLVQEAFVRIFQNVHRLRDAGALAGWVMSVAVFTARNHIRKRRRWRWIRFFAPEEVPDMAASGPSPEEREILRGAYRALERLPADDRLALTLRFVAEMELTEVAEACGVSLATIKRRLARAEARFRTELGDDAAAWEQTLQRGER